jgi:hypothetical protein
MSTKDYESLLERCRQCDHLDNCVKLVASPLTGDICDDISSCLHYEILSEYVVDQIVQALSNMGYMDKIL